MVYPARIFTTLLAIFSFVVSLTAQTEPVKKPAAAPTVVHQKTARFQVLGHCDICRQNIENAAKMAGALQAHWEEAAQQLTIVIDTTRTAVETVQKAIAMAGYDNARYRAPNAAYYSLRKSCQYDRNSIQNKTGEGPADKQLYH